MGGSFYSDDSVPERDARSLQSYYDHVATRARVGYYFLTIARIAVTAVIPLMAVAAPQKSNPLVYGLLGSVVLVIEALNGAFEPGKKWRRYRAADMAIRSEMRLYQSKAGRYSDSQDAGKKLTERLDAIVTAEHNDWQAIQERIDEKQSSQASRPRRRVIER